MEDEHYSEETENIDYDNSASTQCPDDIEACTEGARAEACAASDATEKVQHLETNSDQSMNELVETTIVVKVLCLHNVTQLKK